MLAAADLSVRFGRRPPVLEGACIAVPAGATVGLAGPSGCGKSTLARVLALLLAPEEGRVTLDGTQITAWRHRAPRELRCRVGIVFQQVRSAVDPRLSLAEIVTEPLAATGQRRLARRRIEELADAVGLAGELLVRRPHEVSDGQLQRACVARALALEPRYLICDEMTSMLDPSTQAQLVATVDAYRRRTRAGVLAISHDEPLLARWCDEVHRFPLRAGGNGSSS